jgi:glycosyltransferase involved in cell wall biosynthesis
MPEVQNPRRLLSNTYVDGLISVVIPVRNGEGTISSTLQSVLKQSYRNIEVIVIDDGSTDQTASIVKEVLARDERVTFHSGPQAGVAAARNSGISRARGEFIAPLDADDIWHKDKLILQLNAIRRAGARTGVSYCWNVLVDEADNTRAGWTTGRPEFEGNILLPMLESNFLANGSTPLIRHTCLDLVGGYDPSLYRMDAQGAEDWKLYLALAEICDFVFVPRYLVGYRKSQTAMSANFVVMQRSMDLVRQWARERWPLVAGEHWRRSRYVSNLYLAYAAVESGSIGHGAMLYARAVQAHPGQLASLQTLTFAVRMLLRIFGCRDPRGLISPPINFWEYVEQFDDRPQFSDFHNDKTY